MRNALWQARGPNILASTGRLALALLAASACNGDSVQPVVRDGIPQTTATAGVAAAGQPNIVVILTDDMRADLLPTMPLVRRRLADSGTTYTKAFVPTALCCPSRASLLTGLMQHEHHVMGNSAPSGGITAFNDARSIATELHAAGYVTALVGKYLNGYEASGTYIPPGWDAWHSFSPVGYNNYGLVERPLGAQTTTLKAYTAYATGVLGMRAAAFVRNAPASQPIFLLLTPYAPHADGATTPPPPALSDVGKCAATVRPPTPPSLNEPDVSDKPDYVKSRKPLVPKVIAHGDVVWRAQCEALKSVDRVVAGLIDTLAAYGRLSNSYLVFATDNGYLLGEHRLTMRKSAIYEEAIHAPLIIRGPGFAAHAVDTNLVSLIDVTATIRSIVGVAPWGHGIDIRRGTRDAILVENLDPAKPANEQFAGGLRTHAYAYAEYSAGGPNGAPFLELYDLARDPFELTNVASSPAYAAIVSQLHARMQQMQLP